MRRLVIAGLVLALHAAPVIRAAAPAPAQADPVVRLLADLETALRTGRLDAIASEAVSRLTDDDRRVFDSAVAGSPATTVAVRERARRPTDTGTEVLAEVFVAHGRRGRMATWQIDTRPRAGDTARADLVGLQELASINDLLNLSLDTTRQFAVHDLAITAPDLTFRMASGSAFLAQSENGTTALVLRGAGEIRFAPPIATEQSQLRQFARAPALATAIDSAFIRINPDAFDLQVTSRMLQPVAVHPEDAERAGEIFAQLASRSYNLDLRDLSRDRWSLEPTFGSFVVEFHARRYGWLTYARSPGESEDVSLFDRERRRNIAVYASKEKLAERGEFYSDSDRSSYEVEHYAVDVRIEPARSWIVGHTSLRVRLLQPVMSLTLKLAEPFVVSSINSPELGRLLSLRVLGQNSVIVSMPRVLAPDRVVTLDVDYSGRLDPQALNRETVAVDADQTQSAQTTPSLPEILMLPEPRFVYSNSLAWYPQPVASDYATASMRLTVPAEYQVLGSGTFMGESVASVPVTDTVDARAPMSWRTVRYQADRPVRYLACAISRFVPASRARIDVPALAPPVRLPDSSSLKPLLEGNARSSVGIEVVATPRQVGRSRPVAARAADVIAFYAGVIGEAPYPDLTIAGVDDNLPGGHSPAYFALVQQPLPTTPYSWASDPVAFDSFPNFFLAHEVAHQWWGQAVGWKNYHEQWLSEGLSQYFALLYAEHDRGPGAARSVLGQMRASALEVADRGPIYLGYRLGQIQDDSRVFRAIAYNKSAVVLHMLRRLIGDEAFFRGLKRFYATWRFQKAGTDDLRAAFEAETPLKLDRFLRRWIMDADLPQIRVQTREEEPGRTVVVRIEQVGEPFDFPYTVTIQYQDGSSEAVTIPVMSPVVERRLPLAGPIRRIDTRDELGLVTLIR